MRNGGHVNDIGVDFNTAVHQELLQRVPPGECIADRLGGLGFSGDIAQLSLPQIEEAVTMTADFCCRSVAQVSATLPRTSSSIFHSALMATTVSVAACETPVMCRS